MLVLRGRGFLGDRCLHRRRGEVKLLGMGSDQHFEHIGQAAVLSRRALLPKVADLGGHLQRRDCSLAKRAGHGMWSDRVLDAAKGYTLSAAEPGGKWASLENAFYDGRAPQGKRGTLRTTGVRIQNENSAAGILSSNFDTRGPAAQLVQRPSIGRQQKRVQQIQLVRSHEIPVVKHGIQLQGIGVRRRK